MRDYTYLDQYLDKLVGDIYPQPPDNLQQVYGEQVIRGWVEPLKVKSVLDVGCGQGQFAKAFDAVGLSWEGVTLGTDADICRAMGLKVYKADFSFLSFLVDSSYDLVFARHSLEHSPFPVLTLMEWFRVSKKYLIVVLPNPQGEISESHVGAYKGRNHYSVMNNLHFLWLAQRAGWELVREDWNKFEMRFLLKKGVEVKE